MGGIADIILQNMDFSVSELHVLLRILHDVTNCCLTINGSCSIMQDETDVKTASKIHLKKIIVKASMSTETLIALLEPLVIDQMHLQDCTILHENMKNNIWPTKNLV